MSTPLPAPTPPQDKGGAATQATVSPRAGQVGRVAVALALGALAVGLVWGGPWLWGIIQDEQALEAWVSSLGWLGPLALVLLNAAQIVVAPIPGYVLQIAAGFLYGPLWGGIWGSVGLLLGGSLAFWLARLYGRPLAAYLVGNDRLERWERVTHSASALVWFMLLLGPTGDAPYFLAGLAKVSFAKVLLITLLVRVPSTFVVAAAGAGVMWLSWWQMGLIIVALAVMLTLFLRYQDRIVQWADGQVLRRMTGVLRSDAAE
jgi:uncharacterized membrane protein YdjX (TVP38/TMEM64 family)